MPYTGRYPQATGQAVLQSLSAARRGPITVGMPLTITSSGRIPYGSHRRQWMGEPTVPYATSTNVVTIDTTAIRKDGGRPSRMRVVGPDGVPVDYSPAPDFVQVSLPPVDGETPVGHTIAMTCT